MHRAIARPGAVLLLALAFPGLARSQATATGISRDFNPAISANTLLLYAGGLQAAPDDGDGFRIQESELQLSATVDPFSRADLVFAMDGTEGFELEEGFYETTVLPGGLGARAGKIFLPFGKHNAYHTHQFPFVDRPLAWEELFGPEGLNGVAVEASWLTPAPWYAEVTAYGFPSTEPVFGEPDVTENTWAAGSTLRQLWDTSRRSTVGVGLSAVGGDTRDGTRLFFGSDATWKWTGPGAFPRTAEIRAEWIRRHDDRSPGTRNDDGFYVHVLGKVSRRVALGGRYDLLARSADVGEDRDHIHTVTASLAFVPSEFEALRLDWVHRESGADPGNALRVQTDFTIGSHPAHRY